MAKQKLTVADMKNITHIQALTGQVVQAKQTSIESGVKDADLKTEFDKMPSDYNIATVRHILITTSDPQTGQQKRSDADALKLAKEVKGKLEKGGDWKAIAKQYSEDPGSKENGGLYEKQVVKGWVPEFKDAVNKQEIGKIGEPVKVSYGYHVIQVESRASSSFDKLDAETKKTMKTEMVDKQLQTFLQEEQKKMDIKVTLPAEPAPSAPAASGASPSGAPSASASPSASK
jgi:foldase protein PrsA